VVGYGGNLERENPLEEVHKMIQARGLTTCKLVFSGMDWIRKGGDWAVQLAGELNRRGLPTELTLIGCCPPSNESLPNYVRPAGYLDNSTAAGQREYQALLEQAHFLILPTRADCSPRVIPEANALGVPCITTNVGGIASMVLSDVNGEMFPADDDFVPRSADYILKKMKSEAAYRDLATKTIRDHKRKHTWGSSVQKILEAFETCLR
jgi:glycosyltransferase involved in cell wall biosynthesis